MDSGFPAGRRSTASARPAPALIAAAMLVALAMGIAAPAQAHEPWVAKAWGLNHNGQLGDGTTTGPEECGPSKEACSTTPVGVGKLSGVIAVAGGHTIFNYFSLALLEGGTVMAWGEGSSGQLGDGMKNDSDVAQEVSGLIGASAISAGEKSGYALLSNGTVRAWGGNLFGQLGDGTKTESDVPVAVCAVGAISPCSEESEQLKEVKAIAAGGTHALALLNNGTVVGWGENGSGQLGDGSTTKRPVPVAVTGLSGVVTISAGESYSLAVLSNGAVMAWGNNSAGQLGDGTETQRDAPVAVCASGAKSPCAEAAQQLKGVASVAAGGKHTLALTNAGTVEDWGANEHGQLGNGGNTGPEMCGITTPCSKTPLAVSGLSGVSGVSAGGSHSLALMKDGTATSWGANNAGQLGLGTSVGPEPCGPGACSTNPKQVSTLVAAKGIAGGGEHSLAFAPPPPTVTAVSPNEGPKTGGTTVTITGSELEEGVVFFGSAKATGVTVKSEGTIIEATAPAGTGIVDVTVTTPAGTSAISSADHFNYSRPLIKRISPKRGPASGGTTVTITGVNFTGATAVKFGASNATSVKVNSDSSITAVSPSSTTKLVYVTVTTPSGTSAITGKDRFHYHLS